MNRRTLTQSQSLILPEPLQAMRVTDGLQTLQRLMVLSGSTLTALSTHLLVQLGLEGSSVMRWAGTLKQGT